jgi:hypothetical protein
VVSCQQEFSRRLLWLLVQLQTTQSSQTRSWELWGRTYLLRVGELLWRPLQVCDVGNGDAPLEGGRLQG